MKSNKCDFLNPKVFQVSELHGVNSLSPLPSVNDLSEALLEGKKDEIKSEVMYQQSGECIISSSPSLVLENVSSVECSQLLSESPDNQVIMVSDFLPSPILLSEAHHLNSNAFNPVSFLNDNLTTVTWCNEAVSPLPSAQPGLYSHLISGQKIQRSLNSESFDLMSECNAKSHGDSEVPGKFESNAGPPQPIILITTTLSQPHNDPKLTNSGSKPRPGLKCAKGKAVKRKSKVSEMKKSLKMKVESSSSDEGLSSVSDSNVINLSHSNEILNSLLLNGDNLSSIFPNSTTLQTADLSNSIQIDLSNSDLNIDSFDTSKIDGKKFIYKTLDCDATLMDPTNFSNTALHESLSKPKSSFSNTQGARIHIDSSSGCASTCINDTGTKSIPTNINSKTSLWSMKPKHKEPFANNKLFLSSDSDSVLEASDSFLNSMNLTSSPKSMDLFEDKVRSDSGLGLARVSKLKANEVEPEIGNIELNALHLGSSPPGYTAQLLSQLSHTHCLPSISSSQVSSVLSALEQNEKQPPASTGDLVYSQMESASIELPIKAENVQENEDEDIKVVDGPEESSDYKLKTKVRSPPQRVQLVRCELNGYACYKCSLCPYLSMTQESVITHFQQHQSKLLRKAIRCIGCKNQFYSKFLLKAHLLQDHEVLVDELHPILDAVLAANKLQAVSAKRKQSKFSLISEPVPSKAPEISLPPEPSSITIASPETITPSISIVSSIISPATESLGVDVLSNSTLIEPPKSMEPQESLEPCQLVQSLPPIQSVEPMQHVEEEFMPLKTPASFEPIVEPNIEPIIVPQPLHLSVPLAGDELMNLREMETGISVSANMNMETEVEKQSVQPVKKLTEVKLESDKKKAKKTKVRPVAIKKLLNQEKDGSVPTPPVSGIPPVPLKSKKNSDNGVKCGLEGCSARFCDMNNLELHHRYHDLENSTFKCLDCDHTNPDWSRFSVHLWRSHNINMELYSCALCNYKTSSRSQLHNLHYRIHGEERPFLCDLCGKGFKTTKQLRNHKAVHRLKAISMTETKEILCSICGCSFANSRKLQLHENNIHKKLRPFLCNYCGHKASSRSSLRMHIRQHTGEKPFSCDECDYVTSDHNSMRRHKMRHSGAKRYSCPHCSYACIQSNTYKSHLKRKHPGLDEGLMFCCHLCSFVSVKKENLMSHMTEHRENENNNDRERSASNKPGSRLTSQNVDDVEIVSEHKIECKPPVINSVKSLEYDFHLANVTVIDVLPSNQTLVLQTLDKPNSASVIASNHLESLINSAELVLDVKDSLRTSGFQESSVSLL